MENIRKADVKDISRIAEILIFTKRMDYRSIFQNDTVTFGEMQVVPLAEELARNIGRLANYWIYDDGIVKGLICIMGKEVNELYVDCFFQSQGIGGKLIAFAMNDKGANHLWVLEKNEKAISFYTRHNFVLSGERMLEEGTTQYIVGMVRRE